MQSVTILGFVSLCVLASFAKADDATNTLEGLANDKGRGYHGGLKDDVRSISISDSSDSTHSHHPNRPYKPHYPHKPSRPSRDSSKSSKSSQDRSAVRECESRLGKMDYQFRKCEAEGDSKAKELMAAAKKLERVQKSLKECETKKNCDFDYLVGTLKRATRQAWSCMEDIFPGGEDSSSRSREF